MDSYIRRAIAAYLKYTQAPEHPSDRDSYVTVAGGLRYVVLTSGAKTLAVYRIDNNDRLKRLRRWPAEITATTSNEAKG